MQKSTLINRQQNRISITLSRLEKLSRMYSWFRLTAIIIAVLTGGFAIYFSSNVLAGLSMAIIFFGFGSLTFLHGRVKASITRHQKLQHIYSWNRQRQKLDWAHLPSTSFKADVKHPYAFDLDIYGDDSLLRLIDQTTTNAGFDQLTEWILDPKLDINVIKQRQRYIKTLRHNTAFRNKILLLNLDIKNPNAKINSGKLQDWFSLNKFEMPDFRVVFLTLLGITNIVLFIMYQSQLLAAWWIYTFIAYVILHLWGQLKLAAIFNGIFDFSDDLQKITRVLKYIERFKFPAPSCLNDLVLKIQDKKIRPSRQLRKLNIYIAAIGLRMNPVMAVVMNILLPWDYIVAGQLLKTIPALNTNLNHWFEEWHHLDALSALAQFSWLNDNYTFPVFKDIKTNDAFMETKEIGHPLIEAGQRRCNNFSITRHNRLSLVTGSNMSGKSTFLRTIGVNMVLAFAGAPVCASQFQTSLFRIYSCIRINDSLSEGLSYFYAEVKRLKEILNAIEEKSELPVLFLIDEIFKGTNNKERLQGSLSYIKELSSRNGIGIISTHDLELAQLDREIKNLRNYHFKEDILSGKMHFDYTLREGPSPTTNALKIMKLEGLPVDED